MSTSYTFYVLFCFRGRSNRLSALAPHGAYPLLVPAPSLYMRTDQEFSYAAALPEFPGPSQVTRRNTSDDPDQATAETVALMQAAAIEDSTSPQVWAATQGALRFQGSTQRGACEAIYQWVASHIHFRSDEPVLARLLGLDDELDLLIRPARLLTMRHPAEDCDGFTMLCCSMLLAAEVPCEIVTIKADHEDPSRFSHVYCQAFPDQHTVLVMDCSQAAQHGYPCGWEAPEYFDRKTWGVMEPEPRQQKGLHGLGQSGETDTESMGWLGGGGGGTQQGSGFDLNSLIHQITAGGLQIARMQATPVGYVQTPTMIANYGPGGAPLNFGASGISTSTLLLGGAALLGVLLLARGK
jgi:hypothetical protein